MLHLLTESGVLCQVRRDAEKTYAFQPALTVERLTIAEVIRRLDVSGVDAVPLGEGPEWEDLAQRLESMEQSFRQSPANILLKDLEAC